MLIAWVKQRQDASRLAHADAEALIFSKGGVAYDEAKRRERASLLTISDTPDRRRGRTHWRRVAGIIERRAGR